MNIQNIKKYCQKYKIEILKILFVIFGVILALTNFDLFMKFCFIAVAIAVFMLSLAAIGFIVLGILWLYDKYKENKNKNILDEKE